MLLFRYSSLSLDKYSIKNPCNCILIDFNNCENTLCVVQDSEEWQVQECYTSCCGQQQSDTNIPGYCKWTIVGHGCYSNTHVDQSRKPSIGICWDGI